MSHSRALTTTLIVLALFVPACGGDGPVVDASDPWPLRVPVPGVIGYVTLELTSQATKELLRELVGSTPLGLADGRVVALALDPLALGGAVGVVLPVANEEAFRASLEIMPGFEPLGDGRLRLRLAAESGLAMAIAVYASFTAEASALGMLGAVGSFGDQVLTVYVDVTDGRAFVVPTFDAASAARRACAAIAGLDEPGRAVLTLDLERCVTAYRDALETARRRLLGALGTAQGALAQARSGGAGDPADDPQQELLQRFYGLLETTRFGGDDITGVQFLARPDRALLGPEALAEDRFGGFDALDFRFAWSDASSLGHVLEALRPVPTVSNADLLLRFDPELARVEVDENLTTLFELLTGLPPGSAATWESLLGDLLARMDGLVAVLDPPGKEPSVVAFRLRPGATFDWRGLIESVAAAAPNLDLEGMDWVGIGPDAHVLMDASGTRRLTLGVTEGVAWIGGGDRLRVPTEACAALAASVDTPPADGPVLSLNARRARAALRVAGREAVLHFHDLTGDAGRGR